MPGLVALAPGPAPASTPQSLSAHRSYLANSPQLSSTIGAAVVLGSAIITQWLAKSVYEAAVTPLTYTVVNFLKRQEELDVYDYQTRFNPLSVAE